ncbi:hypothetical protein FO519_002926 [Halicephalobus sp. NKZ332]|nr:hypothetical protein FO519_002926 [Halicephalobus sp. NKZ332]
MDVLEMPEIKPEWFPSAPMASASTSSNVSTDRSEIILPITRKLSLMKKLSLPHCLNPDPSAISTLTRTSSCRSCARKVTWQESSSDGSLSSKYNPFQYSITGIMKVILLIALAGVAYAMNPAMMTSNTYPGASRNNTQTSFTPRRPLFRNGMLSSNSSPYARSAPMMPRDVGNNYGNDNQMRILPYPMEYTNQYPNDNNNNESFESRNVQGSKPYLGVLPQGSRPYLGVLPQGMRPMNN